MQRIINAKIEIGTKVLVRCDFNVPTDSNAVITDLSRVLAAKNTILNIINRGGIAILISHKGRPKGYDKSESLEFLRPVLMREYNAEVIFVPDCTGEVVNNAINNAVPKSIILLENLRFRPEETLNDVNFAKALAGNADLYVNDAFSCSHRAHASISGVTKFLPAFVGENFAYEVEILSSARSDFTGRQLVIVGGGKIETKIGTIASALERRAKVILGGGPANCFLAASGYEIGASLTSKSGEEIAKDLINFASKKGGEIILPKDVVVFSKDYSSSSSSVRLIDCIQKNDVIADHGSESLKLYFDAVSKVDAVLMNGPLGIFEDARFSSGTFKLLNAIASRKGEIFSVLGGGDTLAALTVSCIPRNSYTFVSTAGGAFLEFMNGDILPGINALELNNDTAR